MSKRTATLLASVNVPRTYCRYSQQLHLQPRPCCLNSASTSNDSLLAAASVTTFAGSWSRPGQHLGLKNGGWGRPGARGTSPPVRTALIPRRARAQLGLGEVWE